MSPEQSSRSKYDSKTDMYSLGIIIFEMVYSPFRSEMERIVSITKLRNNHEVPSDFEKRCPGNYKKAIKTILEMCADDPSLRPSSKSLFKMNQDLLYQDMIVSNVEEYKKILNFMFSSRNMFPSNINHFGEETVKRLLEGLSLWMNKEARLTKIIQRGIE